MDKDTAALLKFGIVVTIIVVLLVIWFLTIGAPQPDEEEEAEEVLECLINCAPARIAYPIP
jgi:hypothetical protein